MTCHSINETGTIGIRRRWKNFQSTESQDTTKKSEQIGISAWLQSKGRTDCDIPMEVKGLQPLYVLRLNVVDR